MNARPVTTLCFRTGVAPDQVRAAYAHYSRPKPKYRLAADSKAGIALIDLTRFSSRTCYLKTVGQRGHAAPQSRKARLRGYQSRAIERGRYLDDIEFLDALLGHHQCSLAPNPVGDSDDDAAHCHYYGTFDRTGRLVGYCRLAIYGNFAAAEELIGHRNRDGALYLLLSDIICELIERRTVDYLMFDSYMDACAAQRRFKRRAGFEPYRVRYALA